MAHSSYHEMLFMIDTCQANTMYTHFYSPNILATGSSALDQSSYSHHADNDVGVAVIDRWTYYNLDFLETQVTSPSSQLTLGDLFDSYDESKIHSQPGYRWDLFRGGEEEGRKRLVMDFFGNVQGVEVEGEEEGGRGNESEWREDLRRLGEIMRRQRERNGNETGERGAVERGDGVVLAERPERKQYMGAGKVQAKEGWGQSAMGASALIGCAMVWGGASWLESKR